MVQTTSSCNIPHELQQRQQWLTWRAVPRKDGSFLKPPTTRYGKDFKWANRDNWLSFDTAVADVYNSSVICGIGYIFNKDFLGVDIDDCVRDDGTLEPIAASAVELLDSYTETSVSGTGIHIICKADVKPLNRKINGFEICNHRKYFTMSGHVYGTRSTINERTEQAKLFIETYIEIKKNKPACNRQGDESTKNYNDGSTLCNDIQSKSDEYYLNIGFSKDSTLNGYYWNSYMPAFHKKEGMPDESRLDLDFLNRLAYWCNHNEALMTQTFRNSQYCQAKDKAHIEKLDRLTKGRSYLDHTISLAIAGCSVTAREKDAAYQTKQAEKKAAIADAEWSNLFSYYGRP